MGLYLCVADDDREIGSIDVGSYADFGALREYISCELEAGRRGRQFPTLMNHSDCDGEWSPAECIKLTSELTELAFVMNHQPSVPFASAWQRSVARSNGLVPKNAFESFIDVDGNFLIGSLLELARLAATRDLPILFR